MRAAKEFISASPASREEGGACNDNQRPKTAERLRELKTAGLFACVGGVGFVTDYWVLRLGLHLGLEPAFARIASLCCAMHVTFTINGLCVFRCLSWRKLPKQWGAYLATNGFGNFCNYWIFVTLVSLHSPLWSDHLRALAIGSFLAWVINYLGTRFIAFRPPRPCLVEVQKEMARICPPAPHAPVTSSGPR